MQPKRPSTMAMIAMLVTMIAIIIMVVSMMPWTPWASFDRTRAIGPVNYHLEANFDAIGFDYTMETVDSNGGGDLIGGLGSNFSKSDEKKYPQVRGEVLDNIGIIYNSYRTKAFQYELKMRSPPLESGVTWEGVGNPSATLNITLESDLIPWWPETGSRDLEVKIELIGVDLWDQVGTGEKENLSIQVNKVTVMAKTGYDKDSGEYTGEDKEIGTKDVEIFFHDLGDTSSLDFSISYPTGTEAAGFYVTIEGNMTDYWGRPELSPLSGRANPINIYPMSTGKMIRGIGIPLALPLMIISSILGIIAIVLALFKDKMILSIMAPAAFLSILAPVWFFSGMNAAVELLGERLTGAEEGLSWGPGVFISMAGAILMIAALVISILPLIRSKLKGDTTTSDRSTQEKDGPVFKKIEDKSGPERSGPVFKKIH